MQSGDRRGGSVHQTITLARDLCSKPFSGPAVEIRWGQELQEMEGRTSTDTPERWHGGSWHGGSSVALAGVA